MSFTDKIDLMRNVVPISRAASSLAQLIGRAQTEGAPIIVTQKGYPSGVILSVEHYEALVAAATGTTPAVARETDTTG